LLSDEDIDKIAGKVMEKLFAKGGEYGPLLHAITSVNKTADDVLMYHRLDGIAKIDKVRIYGPPSQYQPDPTAQGAGNPVVFPAYTLIPRDAEKDEKYPLIVLPHGGVHASFGSGYAHFIEELITQGYLVVAPEYRGSTGYGQRLYEQIDYGGLEIEDTFASRNWMVENMDLVDPERVGIMGWSHGGLHTLMNIFKHPESYKAAHASVPVSDLVARMGYKSQAYRDLYEAEYHVGESAAENVGEYRRRSPAWNVPEYDAEVHPPLLVHTTQNDQDVNVLEVQHIIKSLKEKNWDFEYKVYDSSPGGHTFSRLDTKFSKGVRGEVYEFLAKHLKPPGPNPCKKYIETKNPLKEKPSFVQWT